MNEQEEAGSRYTTVEGIKAEGEAIIFGVKMVVQLSKVFFWVLPHSCHTTAVRGRWMHSRVDRSTSSSFSTSSFCIQLEHSMNVML